MKKKVLLASGIICLICISISSIYYYDGYVKEYEYTVNGIYYSSTKNAFEEDKQYTITMVTDELLVLSRNIVHSNEGENLQIEDYEEVIIEENDNQVVINVIHKIPTKITEELPFSKVTEKDDSKYVDYKEVEQPGEMGREIVEYIKVYENGIVIDAEDTNYTTVDPINEITVIGTKEYPVYASSGGSSSGDGNSSSRGNSSTESSNTCYYLDMSCGNLFMYSIDSGKCTLSPGGDYNCPMYWGLKDGTYICDKCSKPR